MGWITPWVRTEATNSRILASSKDRRGLCPWRDPMAATGSQSSCSSSRARLGVVRIASASIVGLQRSTDPVELSGPLGL